MYYIIGFVILCLIAWGIWLAVLWLASLASTPASWVEEAIIAGVDVRSLPLLIAGIAASIAIAGVGVWIFWRWRSRLGGLFFGPNSDVMRAMPAFVIGGYLVAGGVSAGARLLPALLGPELAIGETSGVILVSGFWALAPITWYAAIWRLRTRLKESS